MTLDLPAVIMFSVFVLLTLGITWWAAGRSRSAAGFYVGGGGFSSLHNGLAIAGDYISAASFLGISGLVYANGYDGLVYALAGASGAPVWTFATGAQIRASTPAVDANGTVYIGSYDQNVYAINAHGTLNRVYPTDDAIRSSPVIANGNLYFGSNDHRLYAFAIGTVAAPSAWPMYQVNARRLGRFGSGP